MSTTNKDSFTSSFPIWVHFISASCLIAVARTSSTSWIREVKAGILVLFLILRGTLVVSAHWVWCWQWVCHIWPLLCLGMPPLFPLCWVFIINGCWILLNAFSASIDMIMWFLYFIWFMWCITFIDLRILYHPCILGMNPTWSWCIIFLIYCLIWLPIFYWRF